MATRKQLGVWRVAFVLCLCAGVRAARPAAAPTTRAASVPTARALPLARSRSPAPRGPLSNEALRHAGGAKSKGCNWPIKDDQRDAIPNRKTAASLGATAGGRTLLWRGSFARGWCSFAALVSGHYTKSVASFLPDPTPGAAQPPQDVLKVTYPAGKWSVGSALSLDAWPFRDGRIGPSATLSFSAYFPTNFDFVHGGKLFGLHSGRACSGGHFSDSCFSVRVCFADDAGVFAYIYAPRDRQHPDFYRTVPAFKMGEVGFVAARTYQVLRRGQWNTFSLRVVVNDPGVPNGLLQMRVNGKAFINFPKMYYRHSAEQLIDTIFMQTFYGGSESWWAPSSTQHVLFRDFQLTD